MMRSRTKKNKKPPETVDDDDDDNDDDDTHKREGNTFDGIVRACVRVCVCC